MFLALLQDDFDCVGVDLMESAVSWARLNAPNARVMQGDASQPGLFEEDEFGVVVALGVIEHLQRPRQFIQETSRILRRGGLFLFTTPHPSYALMRLKDPSSHAMHRDPTHINIQPPDTWRAWCQESGFHIERHFGDGLWDVPYLPLLPRRLQFAIFGLPALLQVATRSTINPLSLGVNQIIIARKPGGGRAEDS